MSAFCKKILLFITLTISINSYAIDIEIVSKLPNIQNIFIYDKDNILEEKTKIQISSNFKKVKNINLRYTETESNIQEPIFKFFYENNKYYFSYKNKSTGENKIYELKNYQNNPKQDYSNELYEFSTNKTKNYITFSNYISDIIYYHIKKEPSFFNKKLSYVAKNKNIYSLNISNFDGKLNSTVFRSKAPILSPRISPNGRFIAYVSFEKIVPQVYIVDLQNREKFKISNDYKNSTSPSWSSDSQKVSYTQIENGKSFIINHNITNNNKNILTDSNYYNSNATWLNSNLVYTKTIENGYSSLMIVDFNHKKRRNFISQKYNTLSPYSNGHNYLVYIGNKNGVSTLFKLDSTNLIQKEIISDVNLESPTISSDGSLIGYSTEKNNKNYIQFVDVYGNKLYTLKTQKYNLYEPNLN